MHIKVDTDSDKTNIDLKKSWLVNIPTKLTYNRTDRTLKTLYCIYVLVY